MYAFVILLLPFLKHFLQSSCLVTQRTTRRHILEIMYVQCSLMAFDLYSCNIIMKLMKDKMVKRLPVGAYLVVSCTGAIVFSELKKNFLRQAFFDMCHAGTPLGMHPGTP